MHTWDFLRLDRDTIRRPYLSIAKRSRLNPSMTGLQLNLGLSLFKSGAMKEADYTFIRF